MINRAKCYSQVALTQPRTSNSADSSNYKIVEEDNVENGRMRLEAQRKDVS